jgi:UDP-N-acetylmuramyl pentapeptide phosphotransferase/UDP-N-acetylglucosamine-1-phosphate transferase
MLKELLNNISLSTVLAFTNSFLLVYLVIPNIRSIIKTRRLTDVPDERSSHKVATPTMAGVAFFITLIMTLFFIQNFDEKNLGINIVAAISMIFMVALKDDLVLVPARTKLAVEIAAIGIILFFGEFQLLNLQGFMGFFEIPFIPNALVITIGMLGIINAYNLIDGVDGLASIIALIIFSNFGLIFFTVGNYFFFLICVSFIGMLGAFLFYNFSKTKKIFMGDTGSLIIGFVIGLCAIEFLSMDPTMLAKFSFLPENALILLFSIVSIPIFDTFRVITIRVKNKKSPFEPDRNHLHHLLLDLGFRHHQVALLLGILNYLIIISIAILAKELHYLIMTTLVIVLFGGFILLLNYLKSYINKKH